jgi:hypothetical protein
MWSLITTNKKRKKVKMRIQATLIALLFLNLLNGQNKKLLDPELFPIFGKWKYVESYGGFTGKGTGWPTDARITIEFKKNGKFTHHSKGKLRQRDVYRLSERKSHLSSKLVHVIDYDKNVDQVFELKGDTLILIEDVFDGFTYIFIRK